MCLSVCELQLAVSRSHLMIIMSQILRTQADAIVKDANAQLLDMAVR